MTKNKNIKGFTLIELLVVIAIVAILAVVVVLTLNPAELLKQARDSNRIQDMNTLKSAIGVYLADVTTGISIGSSGTCYMSASSSVAGTNCGFQGTYGTVVSSTQRGVNGTTPTATWIPVDFTDISSGSPIGQVPQDPVNSGGYVYRYVASTTSLTFKLMASLESNKYTAAGSLAGTDGGASSTAYETGTEMSL